MGRKATVIYAYLIPFVGYLLGTTFVSGLPIEYYPYAYSLLVVVLSITTYLLLRGRSIVRPHWGIVEGVIVGLVGIAAWIVISDLQLEAKIGEYLPRMLRPGVRTAYNPFEELTQPWAIYTFIAFRMVGLSLLVPVAEEIFWRGFLARWLISEDWQDVKLGTYTPSSFWYVVGMFTLAHPEWFAAAVYAVLLNGLFYWKKDLWPCIVAHAVSNMALGVYVLSTGNWQLW